MVMNANLSLLCPRVGANPYLSTIGVDLLTDLLHSVATVPLVEVKPPIRPLPPTGVSARCHTDRLYCQGNPRIVQFNDMPVCT